MYAEIINSAVSQEGSNGNYTNYFYYTVLVVRDNGEISVETTKNIHNYLPYMRTTSQKIDELKAEIRLLKKDMEEMVDRKVAYCVDSLFPIPAVTGLPETDAAGMVREAGLIPLMKWNYPASTPAIGKVREAVRDENNFKKIWMDVRHDIPDVVGLQLADADRLLKQAGFSAVLSTVMSTTDADGKVLSCAPEGHHTEMKVRMNITEAIPDVTGMPLAAAQSKLTEAEKIVTVAWTNSDTVGYGDVTTWNQGSQAHTVVLKVSAGATVLNSENVMVSDVTAGEATLDKQYTATAVLDRNKKIAKITITALAGAKMKRTILPDASAVFDMDKPVSDNDAKRARVSGMLAIEPKSDTVFEIEIPWNKAANEIPGYAVVTLKTAYGLIRKEEDLRLRCEFTW